MSTEFSPNTPEDNQTSTYELYEPVPMNRRTLIALRRGARIREIVSPLFNDVPETVSLEYKASSARIALDESCYPPSHTLWLRRLPPQ